MAERKSSTSPSTQSKGGASVFTKQVQRKFSRAQEKVLQKIGKSEETRDEQFERFIHSLQCNQSTGYRICRDLKAYINAVKVMHDASSRLFQSFFDDYDLEWDCGEDLGVVVEGENLLWNDYEKKLRDQALLCMEAYMSQFPDVKEKVAKRGRKLVDYDSSRHHLESLQNAKKRDDIKINKAEEEMKTAKKIFEDLNTELKEELPGLLDSRVGCYVHVFKAISTLRENFYKELTKSNETLQDVMKVLKDQHSDKDFVVKNFSRASLKRRSLKDVLSPRSLRSSFHEFHMNYNPRGSLRREQSSFRSDTGTYMPYSPGVQTSPTKPKPMRDPKFRDADSSFISEEVPEAEAMSSTPAPDDTEASENKSSATKEDVKPEDEGKENKEGKSLPALGEDEETEGLGLTGASGSQEANKEKEPVQGINDSGKADSEDSPLLKATEAPEDHTTRRQEQNEPGMKNGIAPNHTAETESEASWKDTSMDELKIRELKEEAV